MASDSAMVKITVDSKATEKELHQNITSELSPRNSGKGRALTGGNSKSNVTSEKINGELLPVEKSQKGLKITNRARSRSKSPRGKSPEKKEPEKKVNAKKSPLKSKKEPKGSKGSPKRKVEQKPGPTVTKDKSPECSKPADVDKESTKRAKKRKVTEESSVEEKNVIEDVKSEPKVKKSKSLVGSRQNIDKGETDIPLPKPKRKYSRKVKKQNDELDDSLSPECKQSKKGLAKSSNIKSKADASVVLEPAESLNPVLQNGELSPNESNEATDTISPNIFTPPNIDLPPKKVHKKGVRKQKVDKLHAAKSVETDATTAQTTGELEDSDTVDYSVSNGGGNIISDPPLREKKIVKIDDIEITELSDLNSSRESGDETLLDSCLVEKPQPLNYISSSRPASTEIDDSDVPITLGIPMGSVPVSTALPIISAGNIVHGIETVVNGEKVFMCDQSGCKYRGKTRVLLRKHLNHHGIYHCAHCEFIGYRYPDLESHMVANHPQRWGRKKCKKCTRYIPGDEFEAHEHTCEGIKIVTCEICGKEFKFESLAREHAKKMHKSHNCQVCDFVGDTKQILSHHMSQVHPKIKREKQKCKQCDSLFSTKKLLTEHVVSIHGTPPKAMGENIYSSSASATIKPENTVADEAMENAPKSPVSDNFAQSFKLFESPEEEIKPEPSTDLPNEMHCSNSFQEKTDYDIPYAKVGARNDISMNSANNQQLSVAASISIPHNTSSVHSNTDSRDCKNLQQVMVNSNNFTGIPNESNTDGSALLPYNSNIPQSSMEFNNRNAASIEGNIAASNIVSNVDDRNLNSGGKLQTLNPVPMFNQSMNMTSGQHVQAAPAPLPVQGSQYPNIPEAVYKEERPYACTKCPKRFKDSKTLNGHQNVHSTELNFKCNVETCLLAFKTNRLLNFHKKTVHDVAPGVPTYPCDHPDCHLVFKKRGQLKKHEVVHTGERRYICEWANCGKAFRHNANLKIHHLLHTGEKPIKCQYCEFACRQKSSLIHHMKTKHKEVGWPLPKREGVLPQLQTVEHSNNLPEEKGGSESHDDSKSDLDTSFEGDLSGNTTDLPKEENPGQQVGQQPVYPKMLSTPTKAMVKAMAPGFRLNTPGFEKMKPISPIASGGPPPLFSSGNVYNPQVKADIYDFDEDDDSGIPVSLSKKLEKGQVKSPGRPAVGPHTSSLDMLQAMEPINLSADIKPVPDEQKVVKKKRTPKKKKAIEENSSKSSDQFDTSSSSGLNNSFDSSVDHSKEQINDQISDSRIQDQSSDSRIEDHSSHSHIQDHSSDSRIHDQSSDSRIQDHSSDSHIQDHSMDLSREQSLDQSIERSFEQTEKPDEESRLDDGNKTEASEIDMDTGIRSQESSVDRCSDDIVEEHVSENVQMSVSSSAASSLPQNQDNEEDMQEPEAVLPSQPEPYPDHPTANSPRDVQSSEESPPQTSHHPEHMHSQHHDSHDSDIYQNERMGDSNVSDIPQDVEDLALQRSLPPVSPGSMHNMHSPGKARDAANHSFDLPHDIDPDEAAKLLEEHDSFQEDEKNTSIGSHEVPVIMSSSSQPNKEDYLPPSPPSHNSIHREHEQSEINDGQYEYAYGQQQQHHHHHPHHGDYNQIHDMSIHEKERVEPENYSDPSQRRPSSSYVPDFLPTSGLGSSGLGPPSVSSSYSSPSYSVPSQSQPDLPTYGAPGSNLPQYPPLSSSVPYLSSPPTSTNYPTTTSAGSGISSYPPITTTSYHPESQQPERVPSVTDARPGSNYKEPETTTVTSSSAYSSSTYAGSRDLFGHYFQDPNLPLSHIAAASQTQDPRALPGYPSQQSSLQALQRSSADFLQRASAGALPGMNYPSVTESLARLSQTTTQQPWIAHADDRSRPWAQASPIIMPPELETAANRTTFSAARPEYPGLDSGSKRPDSAFPVVPSQASLQSATERYNEYMGSVAGAAGHFPPGSTYSKSLPSVVSAPTKQLEEAYRQSAAQHMTDYRTLSQAPPSMTDMYSRMGMNPPTLSLDKYYPYSRDAMYRSQHIGSATNPFMPQTSSAQMQYADREYAARNPYAQDSAYSKYLQPSNLTQPIPGLNAAPSDYFQARPGAPDPYDPYRRSVIHNMMSRFY